MEPIDVVSQTNTSAAATAPPLEPEAIVEQLRALREQIPEYLQLAVTDARSLRRVAHVAGDFIQATINTVGASPQVQNVLGKSPAELRQDDGDAGRWTAVEDELRAMLKGVAAANLTRRHRIGLTALQTYGIARQLVRQKENANLLPHVQEMKRLNTFGRSRRKAVPPAPGGSSPGPLPAPATTSHP
jgi:hypothetical protein